MDEGKADCTYLGFELADLIDHMERNLGSGDPMMDRYNQHLIENIQIKIRDLGKNLCIASHFENELHESIQKVTETPSVNKQEFELDNMKMIVNYASPTYSIEEQMRRQKQQITDIEFELLYGEPD